MQTRRQFILNSGKAGLCLGCLGSVALLEGCVSYMVPAQEEKDQLAIDRVFLLDEKSGQPKQFVLVQSNRYRERIYLSGISDENYAALLTHCTHKGCELKPAGDILICPCHGSEFSSTGKVLESPAERDLMQFRVSHDSKFVYIHLN